MFGINESMLTLEFAFVLGALHALEPGHGKTAMVAYMLGEKRGFWHALAMGMGSAISHSASIFIIALLTHIAGHTLTHGHATASAFTRPLEWTSGIVMTAIGIYLFAKIYLQGPKLNGAQLQFQAPHESGGDCCAHHRQKPKLPKFHEGPGYHIAALLGISGGLIPCPTALAAYVSSLGTVKAASALMTVGVFSLGIAVSLTVVGVSIKYAGKQFSKLSNLKKHERTLSYARATLIFGVGSFYLVNLVAH